MFIETFVFILGLCIGSFLDVCIYRLPRGLSIVNPVFSFCPHCKETIKWYDNIPLLSFLFLKGKCRFCGGKISGRYFLVELLTGIVFLFTFLKLGFSFLFVKYIVLFILCILVSFIDIDYHAIPGEVCIFGIFTAVVMSLINTGQLISHKGLLDVNFSSLPVVDSIKGLFLGIGLSYSLKIAGDFGLWIYLSLKKQETIEGEKESLGLGDVDFLGMVGAFLGWKLSFLTFFLAPVVSLVYGVYIISFKKSHLIAYLPFLSLACFISAFWGDKIIKLILPF